MCRFHKANFEEIDKLRQKHLELRACESLGRDGRDYRAVVRDSYNELKKLTVIAEKMKSLDRDKELLEEIKAERSGAEIDKIMAAFRARPSAGK